MADRIRLARRAAKMTQAKLAETTGVSPSAVAQWEHPNGTHPNLARLRKIAALTSAPFVWLALGEGPPFKSNVEEPAAALVPSAFAQDLEEENLLREFRLLSPQAKHSVVCLVEELATHGKRRRVDRH
jgi:transcriptional regulator with XRE-family HTH domain